LAAGGFFGRVGVELLCRFRGTKNRAEHDEKMVGNYFSVGFDSYQRRYPKPQPENGILLMTIGRLYVVLLDHGGLRNLGDEPGPACETR
jgi:hypothetical protein